jgi:probable rRNA maturation factor
MDLQLDVQVAVDAASHSLPTEAQLHEWASAVLAGRREVAELSVRIVDAAQSAELNERYRQKAGPTNVLSFAFEAPAGVELPLLGDLVICAEVVENEADEQHKTPMSHWAHMIVHGTLHLLGYDHQDDQQAAAMEAEEIKILQALGFANPYEVTA